MSAQQVSTPTGETRTALVRRARRMNKLLAETYPAAHCEPDFTTPRELGGAFASDGGDQQLVERSRQPEHHVGAPTAGDSQ